MNRFFAARGFGLAVLFAALVVSTQAQGKPPAAFEWKDALKQKAEWYAGEEAVRVADNLLVYQRDTGGWPKNVDMAAPLNESKRAALMRQKGAKDSTIDNGATFTQLEFLARVHTSKKLERHGAAFLKGLDYLLAAQYENGGWPQYYPLRKGYYTLITFNDNAMAGVLSLLREVARATPNFAFVDEARRARAAKAVERGVECILKSQVVVAGKRTAWGAQHDEITLAPATARKFEPVALASKESVGITRFLMGVEAPDARVVEAVESAVAWFKVAQVSGVRWVERRDPSKSGGYERTVVSDDGAPPIWARFYEIGTNRPVFEGRDGVVRYSVLEIEAERRNGYGWYTEEPNKLLAKDYPAWQKRLKNHSTEQAK